MRARREHRKRASEGWRRFYYYFLFTTTDTGPWNTASGMGVRSKRDQDRTGEHDGTVDACEALPWSVQCGDRSPCPRQDKNLKSSATWLLVPHKTLSSYPAWEGPEKGGVKTPHRSNLTTQGSESEQFTASGPLHPANSRRDPDFWLVHGSKDSAAEGALLSPWCSEYCLTGEGLSQGHLGTAEEILGSIGKRCGPLWDHRAEHGKTRQSNCWERGTKNTLYISDVYYIHAQPAR